MKTKSINRQHLLLSLSVVICLFMAVGLSYAESNQSDAPRQQRKFQGQERGQRQGQRQGKDRSQTQHSPFRTILKELNLTEDQRAQIKEVVQNHREQFATFREENGDAIKEWHMNMRQAMKNKDYPAMHNLIDQLEVLEKNRPTFQSLRDDIRSILTSDQQVIFDKKVEELKNKRSKKHMRRRGGQDGSGNADGAQRPRRRNPRNTD